MVYCFITFIILYSVCELIKATDRENLDQMKMANTMIDMLKRRLFNILPQCKILFVFQILEAKLQYLTHTLLGPLPAFFIDNRGPGYLAGHSGFLASRHSHRRALRGTRGTIHGSSVLGSQNTGMALNQLFISFQFRFMLFLSNYYYMCIIIEIKLIRNSSDVIRSYI